MSSKITHLVKSALALVALLTTSVAMAEPTTTKSGYNTTVVSPDTTGIVRLDDWRSSNQNVHSSKSIYTVTYNVRYGSTVNFKWRVSSEKDYDHLTITIDGTAIVSAVSGEQSGEYEMTYTSAGKHKVVVTYEKDNIMSGGKDEAYVTDFIVDHETNAGATSLLPFHTTTITNGRFAAGTRWYLMRQGTSNYYLCAEGDSVAAVKEAAVDSTFYWAFVGNADDGISIYNMKTGATCPLTVRERVNKGRVTLGGGDGDTRFRICDNATGGSTFWLDGDTCAISISSYYIHAYKPANIAEKYNTGSVTRTKFEYVGEPPFVPIQSITEYVYGDRTILAGESTDVYWFLNPSNTTETKLTFSVSDPSVLSYTIKDDKFAQVTGLKGGKATFYIRSAVRPQIGVAIDFTVKANVLVESIALEADTIHMWKGDMHPLKVDVQPANAVDPTYTWTNSSPAVASITPDNQVYAMSEGTTTLRAKANDKGGVSSKLVVVVNKRPTATTMPYDHRYLYALRTDGSLYAIPKSLLVKYTYVGKTLSLTLVDTFWKVITDVESVTDECPVELPQFSSYKFNNKFNDQLLSDAIADEAQLDADTLRLSVTGIGKRLTASYQLADSLACVWVGDTLQKSKSTRQRFDHPVTYTIGHPDWYTLTITTSPDGYTSVGTAPFGRRTTVVVDWATEHSTTPYGVPRIDITFGNGTWNGSNYIASKTNYTPASIRIDGGGVYPDLEDTPIEIKGRGNSSWSTGYTAKNPYHFRFDEKHKVLGLKSGKHWLLIANSQKGSLMTNAIAQRAAQMFGVAYANHIVPVELYINGSYRGSYNITERIALANNSIDLDDDSQAAVLELDTYTDEYIIKEEGYYLPVKLKDAYNDTITVHQDAVKAFTDLTMAVSRGRNIDGLIDIDHTAAFLLTNEFVANCELKHPKSVFLYNENIYDSNGTTDPTPWVFGPVWDCDWAFGYQQSRTYFVNSADMDYYNDMGTSDNYWEYPRRFWSDLRYGSEALARSTYNTLFHFVTQGGLDELKEYVADYYDFAKASFTHNASSENATGSRDATTYKSQVATAQTWLAKRASTLLGQTAVFDLSDDEDADQHPTDEIKGVVSNAIGNNGQLYDLQGRRVTGRPAPGVYVLNGRKVLIK